MQCPSTYHANDVSDYCTLTLEHHGPHIGKRLDWHRDGSPVMHYDASGPIEMSTTIDPDAPWMPTANETKAAVEITLLRNVIYSAANAIRANVIALTLPVIQGRTITDTDLAERVLSLMKIVDLLDPPK